MKLTTNDIKQLVKEELSKLLNENLFRANLEIMDQQQRREPQAWEQETDQYIQMLINENFEEFYLAIYDDLPMLAHVLNQKDKVQYSAQRFLGSIANMEDSGKAGQLVEDYVINRPGTPTVHMIKRRFESIELAGDEAEVHYLLHGVARLFQEDQIFCGYFGIIRASVRNGELFLRMEKDNLEDNVARIRDLWHGNYYKESYERRFTMVSSVSGNSNMKKYSTLKVEDWRTELILGMSERV